MYTLSMYTLSMCTLYMNTRVVRYWIQARDQVGLYSDTHNIEQTYIKNEIYSVTFFRLAILLSCSKKFHPSKVQKIE